MRSSRTGNSRSGAGAPTASGAKNWRGSFIGILKTRLPFRGMQRQRQVLTSALGLTRLATLSFGVIPSGQSLKIRHKAEPFLGIRRQDGLGCHDVDQRRSVLQRATQRAFEFRRLFDALAMRPEGAGEARIVRVAQSGADDAAAIVHFLIQPLD